LLKDKGWKVQHKAFSALVRIGPPAVPALRDAFQNEDKGVRRSALVALRHLGEPAVPVLVESLRGEDALRDDVLHSLGEMGPEAKEAVPALLGLLEKAPESAIPAAKALWLVAKHPAAGTALRKALADKDGEVRLYAAVTAGELDLEAKAAVPVLAEALKRGGDFVRPAALQALLRFGKGATAAVPALVDTKLQ
jgi:HEAT repeat protein